MRSETVERDIYEFNELPESVQQEILESRAAVDHYWYVSVYDELEKFFSDLGFEEMKIMAFDLGRANFVSLRAHGEIEAINDRLSLLVESGDKWDGDFNKDWVKNLIDIEPMDIRDRHRTVIEHAAIDCRLSPQRYGTVSRKTYTIGHGYPRCDAIRAEVDQWVGKLAAACESAVLTALYNEHNYITDPETYREMAEGCEYLIDGTEI